MAVTHVETLGCHPILLLKKLATAGGITILTEEKHTYDGVDYPYRIVARVSDSLYLEAHDPLYEQATDATLLPCCAHMVSAAQGNWDWGFGTFDAPLAMEALATDKGKSTYVYSGADRIVLRRETDLAVPHLGLSILATTVKGVYGSAYYGTPWYNGVGIAAGSAADAAGVMLVAAASGAGFAVANGNLSGMRTRRTSSNTYAYIPGIAATAALDGHYPFFVLHSADPGARTLASVAGGEYSGVDTATPKAVVLASADAGLQDNGFLAPRVLLVSGTVVRVASAVTGNELTSPSAWHALPIFAKAVSTGAEVFFVNGPDAEYGGVLALTTIDTSLGNGMSGTYPAIYKSFKHSHYTAVQEGEACRVLGMDGNAGATGTFSIYAPSPPISQDSVAGGPIVVDLYAYSETEVRGAVRGMLGAPVAVALNTVGWLDGNRYSVQVPTRMIRIG